MKYGGGKEEGKKTKVEKAKKAKKNIFNRIHSIFKPAVETTTKINLQTNVNNICKIYANVHGGELKTTLEDGICNHMNKLGFPVELKDKLIQKLNDKTGQYSYRNVVMSTSNGLFSIASSGNVTRKIKSIMAKLIKYLYDANSTMTPNNKSTTKNSLNVVSQELFETKVRGEMRTMQKKQFQNVKESYEIFLEKLKRKIQALSLEQQNRLNKDIVFNLETVLTTYKAISKDNYSNQRDHLVTIGIGFINLIDNCQVPEQLVPTVNTLIDNLHIMIALLDTEFPNSEHGGLWHSVNLQPQNEINDRIYKWTNDNLEGSQDYEGLYIPLLILDGKNIGSGNIINTRSIDELMTDWTEDDKGHRSTNIIQYFGALDKYFDQLSPEEICYKNFWEQFKSNIDLNESTLSEVILFQLIISDYSVFYDGGCRYAEHTNAKCCRKIGISQQVGYGKTRKNKKTKTKKTKKGKKKSKKTKKKRKTKKRKNDKK